MLWFACAIIFNEKMSNTSDLFGDGGVVKTVLRPSTDPSRPKQGDEVVLTYTIKDGPSNQSLVYKVGDSSVKLFLPLRTLDKIICDMRRNEKASIHVGSAYGVNDNPLTVEVTLLQVRKASMAGVQEQSGSSQSSAMAGGLAGLDG